MTQLRERPPVTATAPIPDADQVSQEIPTVNLDEQVFSFIENVSFKDFTVEGILMLVLQHHAAAKFGFTGTLTIHVAQLNTHPLHTMNVPL